MTMCAYDHGAGRIRIPVHCGPKYTEFCKEWKKAMIEEYFNDKLNFEMTRRLLEIEFCSAIKVAENQGVFAEEDKEYFQKARIEQIKKVGEGKTSIGLEDWTDRP